MKTNTRKPHNTKNHVRRHGGRDGGTYNRLQNIEHFIEIQHGFLPQKICFLSVLP